MNREIKFRAWDNFVKRMYGGGVELRITEFGLITITNRSWQKKQKDSVVLLQYTGLKDKNGKEIYEGDIVEVDNSKQVVSWLYSSWNVFDNTGEYGYSSQECEVIGNLFENPELLKH